MTNLRFPQLMALAFTYLTTNLLTSACSSDQDGLEHVDAGADAVVATADGGRDISFDSVPTSPDASGSADVMSPQEAGIVGIPDARLPAALGASCSLHTHCLSELCVGTECEERCDIERPNDCSNVGGFCVPTTAKAARVNYVSNSAQL